MYRLKPFGVLNGREVPVIELFNDKFAVELLPTVRLSGPSACRTEPAS